MCHTLKYDSRIENVMKYSPVYFLVTLIFKVNIVTYSSTHLETAHLSMSEETNLQYLLMTINKSGARLCSPDNLVSTHGRVLHTCLRRLGVSESWNQSEDSCAPAL